MYENVVVKPICSYNKQILIKSGKTLVEDHPTPNARPWTLWGMKVILVCVCCCNKDHDAKATWRRGQGVFGLLLPLKSPLWREVRTGTRGRSLKAGTEGPWRNAAAYSPWLAWLAFLDKLGPLAQRWCCPHPRVGWANPSHSLVQYLTGMPTGQSDGGHSLFEVPSSQVTPVCVKLV